MKKPALKPSEWKRRRFRLDIALLAILVWVSFILWKGVDLALYQQAVIALIAAGVALIGQYVFGAVWDDKNYMNALASLHGSSNDITSDPETDSQIPDSSWDSGTSTKNSGNSTNE